MTYYDKYIITTNWLDKIKLIYLYHQIKLFKNSSWTIRRTADYFKISIGLCSENIHLGTNIEIICDCATRKDALKLMKEMKK